MTTPKMNPAARHYARRLAVQAVYQWQLSDNSILEIQAQFAVDKDMKKADNAYFQELLQAVLQQHAMLDEQLIPCLDRPLTELNPIELAILRISTYELTQRLEIPYRVVINEAIELAKIFGAVEGYKYVNGVLDKLAQQVRKKETM